MKVLASLLLGVCLLSAEDTKSPVAPAKTATPTAPTSLTEEENQQLIILLLQAQSARIGMLEHLTTKSAGSEDLNLAEQASTAYSTMLKTLAKKHSAADTCQWNFISKSWQCPTVTPAPTPPATDDKR